MMIANTEFQKNFQGFVEKYGDVLIPVLKRMNDK